METWFRSEYHRGYQITPTLTPELTLTIDALSMRVMMSSVDRVTEHYARAINTTFEYYSIV